jgi:hypothetical protein
MEIIRDEIPYSFAPAKLGVNVSIASLAPDFLRLEHLAASCLVCPLIPLLLAHSYIDTCPPRW